MEEAVEAGRGFALVQDGLECLSGPCLTLRKIVPAPPLFVVGVAYQSKVSSVAAMAFIDSAKS